MNNTVGIMGCGWLGTPLALSLLKKGHVVKGTTTQIMKLQELRDAGIDPYLVELKENFIHGGVDEFLKDLNVLIINIPPGLRKNPESDYPGRMELLVKTVSAYPSISRLLFVSTTSVFAELSEIPVYDEFSVPNEESPTGKKLIEGEKIIQGAIAETTIIRPGGLIGVDRHPIKYLAGRKEVENPAAPVNLTSQSALIESITITLQIRKELKVLHVISEPYQNREDYYKSAAIEFGLEPPEFSSASSVGKRIVSRFR